jgi:hypothetical protein
MSVNFTGIKDCHIYKKEYQKFGPYLNESGDIEYAKKNYKEYIMTAKLTDDKDGNHLTEYRRSIPQGFENAKGRDIVKLHIKKFTPEVEDDFYTPKSTSFIKLNDKDLVMNNDEKMHIMTFLAHSTKRDVDKIELSDKQKECVKDINDSIADVAMEYLYR